MSVVIESLGVRLGKRMVLEGIDLELPDAGVTGLVGRNGAGKSTLLKAVVGIIRPSAGAVRFGDEADDHVSIGYLPEYVGFVEHLSGLRNLRLLADLGRSQNDVDPGALLDRVGLDGRDRRPVSTYSQGMRRRLGIAQAIMDGPSVVVLDEPANGLDPDGIRWVRELVRDLARHGACVVVASHLLGELELSCDHLVMLNGGRVVFDGHRSHIEQYVRTLRVQVDDAESRLRLESVAVVDWVDESVGLIEANRPAPDLIAQMVAACVRLRSVGPTATALEDLYLRLSKDGDA